MWFSMACNFDHCDDTYSLSIRVQTTPTTYDIERGQSVKLMRLVHRLLRLKGTGEYIKPWNIYDNASKMKTTGCKAQHVEMINVNKC